MAKKNDGDETVERQSGRRGFLRNTSLLGAAAAVGCGTAETEGTGGTGTGVPTPTPEPVRSPAEVAPGELDAYYGFWSGGQSGEVRILGVPSMRELKRIPVFNRESATGHGATDWTKQAMGGMAVGDTHHVHLSYNEGTYDGRFMYVNDKANARLARVRLDVMECDAITEIPNAQGTHGIFPQRHRTGLVLCNSEFQIPTPNDGSVLDDPSRYFGLHTAVDGETMEVRWQVKVPGNMDLCATDYQGNYSFATCYNSERGVHLEDMMSAEQDWLYVFNIPEIERAVAAGNTIRIGNSPVPVVDATAEAPPYVIKVPVAKSPHGVNIDPTGRYAVVAGKLSPTATVVDITRLADAFAGTITPADTICAQPELGLGPLHTAFDGRGNAYTSIFIDSNITKWSLDLAVRKHAGEDVEPVLNRVDVQYQVGHTNASMSETREADGRWLVALCKFSKDRFLNVGPHKPENDQLVDISGDTMTVVHDGPTFSEPHDCVVVRADLIHPTSIQNREAARFQLYDRWAAEDGIDILADSRVIRKSDRSVRVWMTSRAPSFALNEITVKTGDEVQIILTNQDDVEDLSHGLCISRHDVCFVVNPRDTNSITFTAGAPGVYWYYCPWFCHAMHLEMRGRLFVEPR
jgi:nitrous-oxide reductase